MKIKLIEPGYEGFSGMFGTVPFQDGVSVDHVSHVEINLLASIVKVVDAESEAEVGNLATETASWDKTADVIYYPTLADIEAGRTSPETMSPVQRNQSVEVKLHTRASLEEIADKNGLAGLREIADPLEIKATSISKLIDKILGAQAGVATDVSESEESDETETTGTKTAEVAESQE